MNIPDPSAADRADDAAVRTLLNCYLRETSQDHADGERVSLPRTGVTLAARRSYRSATGRHGWDLPVSIEYGLGLPLSATSLAALIAAELGGADPDVLTAAVGGSVLNASAFVRAARPAEPGTTPYLAAEQSLVLGHPMHPTAKERDPMTLAEVVRYAPETRAGFPLHWFRADRDLVSADNADPGTDTVRWLADLLAGDADVDPAVARDAADGRWAFLPTHPWQAPRLAARPAVATLLASGRLVDLGVQGGHWHPTSSVRTLYRADAAYQLKFSLDTRITNSVRRNLRKELARGAEVARLLDAGLGADLAGHFPAFGIVRDPGWITLDDGGGAESGFEVVLRANPYPNESTVDASVVAALCADQPDGGPPVAARLIRRLAEEAGRAVPEVAREWFGRYLTVAADPLIWLDAERGIALEAHQQNTVLELADGWPAGFRYRDNQGYYFRESGADRLRALLPTVNAESDTICADAVADERFTYYVGLNNLLGLVGALGIGGVAAEEDLLADLADHLRTAPSNSPLRRLLDVPVVRGKANLRTRLAGMDELVGPMATQSVYVEFPNPLAAAAR